MKKWLKAVVVTVTMNCIAGAAGYSQVAITGTPTKSSVETVAEPSGNQARHERSGGNTDTMLADTAQRYAEAVGVVVAAIPGYGPLPIGTAWAFEDRLFATNAHVVGGMRDVMETIPQATFYVAINRRPDLRLKVTGISTHPEYGKQEVRFDGRAAHSGFDLAVLRTQQAAPVFFQLADEQRLHNLRSGDAVGYLGFPMESLSGDNVDATMPIATMQTGIVSAVSDYFMADSGYANNRLIRHNLPSAGGASGSPIFTPDGVVVAILWGGNMNMDVSANLSSGEVEVKRQPSAAMVNFAERIDGLSGVPRP